MRLKIGNYSLTAPDINPEELVHLLNSGKFVIETGISNHHGHGYGTTSAVPKSFRETVEARHASPAFGTAKRLIPAEEAVELGEALYIADPGLTFNLLREVNQARCEDIFHPLEDWSATDWATALAGEVGELCNYIKKLRRGENITTRQLADELADTIIYADLLAAVLGIDLGEAVRAKFNLVSEQKGAHHRL